MWHSKTLQFEAEAKKGSSADEAYERRKPIVHLTSQRYPSAWSNPLTIMVSARSGPVEIMPMRAPDSLAMKLR